MPFNTGFDGVELRRPTVSCISVKSSAVTSSVRSPMRVRQYRWHPFRSPHDGPPFSTSALSASREEGHRDQQLGRRPIDGTVGTTVCAFTLKVSHAGTFDLVRVVVLNIPPARVVMGGSRLMSCMAMLRPSHRGSHSTGSAIIGSTTHTLCGIRCAGSSVSLSVKYPNAAQVEL